MVSVRSAISMATILRPDAHGQLLSLWRHSGADLCLVRLLYLIHPVFGWYLLMLLVSVRSCAIVFLAFFFIATKSWKDSSWICRVSHKIYWDTFGPANFAKGIFQTGKKWRTSMCQNYLKFISVKSSRRRFFQIKLIFADIDTKCNSICKPCFAIKIISRVAVKNNWVCLW